MTNVPSLSIDFSEIEGGMDVILSMAKAVQSKRVQDAVIKSLSRSSTERFFSYADQAAASGSYDISHMYEWDKAGDPKSRLFSMKWTGQRGSYKGDIRFHHASMEIPVPISRAHQAYIDEVNAGRSPDKGQVRLARYVWLDKAYQLETKSRFPITPQGSAVKRDGWVRVREGNPSPARALMVEANGEIRFFKRFTQKYSYQGKFTAFFEGFWNEGMFEQLEFKEFEKRYHKVIEGIFSKEIRRAQISTPMRFSGPGIHMFSKGKRDLSRVTGRERAHLVKAYEKGIMRGVLNSARR